MPVDRTFEAVEIRTLGFGDVSTSYAAIGSPLDEALYIMVLKNATNATIVISEDGSTDHYKLQAGTVETYDLQSNRADALLGVKPKGVQFYAKGISGALPSAGEIIVEGQTL